MYHEKFKPFLKDSQGKFRTNSLFLEPNYADTVETALFTLKEDDHTYNGKLFLSLKKIYLTFSDPTEYEFAKNVFGSWDHWQKIRNNQVLRPFIDAWEAELEVKLRSAAVINMISLSQDPEMKNFGAMKWASEGGWKEVKRGRVSKKEKEQEVRREAGIVRSINEDLARMGG